MSFFFDCPLEVIEEVINSLQDDLKALKACSQTCLLLLPLSRKHIFRSIVLESPITEFGLLLDDHPRISDHVQKVIYIATASDPKDDDLPVLERLHRVHTLQLVGEWNELPLRSRDVLLRFIQSPCLTRLELHGIDHFPITALIPCENLTDIALSFLEYCTVVESNEQDPPFLDAAAPQLRSFAFTFSSGQYAMALLNARRYNDVPILDFRHIRTLAVKLQEYSDLDVVHALVKTIEKLETLEYYGTYQKFFTARKTNSRVPHYLSG